ncbi:MAG: mechanosensitive ion channel family protein [Aquabacterium sp.]|nr:mechanosensitive ion channel family protein [Aquabacterium sp.]
MVSLQVESAGVLVQIDGATSFVVTQGDLDPGRDDTLVQTAQNAAAAMRLVIGESLESRNIDMLARELATALAATAVAATLLWLSSRARRVLSLRLLAATEKHASRLSVGGIPLLRRERLNYAVRLMLALVYRLLMAMVLVEWLSFVLRCFPFTRAWGESLNTFLADLALQLLSVVVGALPELLAAGLIFYAAWLVSKGIDRFFASVRDGSIELPWLDPDVAAPSQRISKVVVWLFALAMAYPYLPGSQTEAFKGLSVLLGLMLSLGASSLVGQAASGMILTYSRVFRRGEYVRLGEHEGTVTEMGMFTTRIRTGLGEELTISNATILGSTTKNYSRAVNGAGFVVDTTLTIGYDTPWRQVHAMMIEAANRTTGVLREPAPQVFQTALSDWYPEYRLVCQAIPSEPRPRALVLSALHGHLQDVFNEYGVQIMSPQYFEDPAQAKIVPPDQWYAAPATPPDVGAA